MADQILAWLQAHYYYVLMAGGAFVMFGCWRNWEWMARIGSPTKLQFLRIFIEEVHGVEARYKFERAVTFIAGLVIFLVGAFYGWYELSAK